MAANDKTPSAPKSSAENPLTNVSTHRLRPHAETYGFYHSLPNNSPRHQTALTAINANGTQCLLADRSQSARRVPEGLIDPTSYAIDRMQNQDPRSAPWTSLAVAPAQVSSTQIDHGSTEYAFDRTRLQDTRSAPWTALVIVPGRTSSSHIDHIPRQTGTHVNSDNGCVHQTGDNSGSDNDEDSSTIRQAKR